jgi:hypothetical protein
VSDVYSFDSDATAPTDAQKRLLYLQQLRQAANATPGQAAAAAPNIPNVDPAVAQTSPADGMLQALRAANATPPNQSPQGQVPAALSPQPDQSTARAKDRGKEPSK